MKPRGDRITSLAAMRRQEAQLQRAVHAAIREYLTLVAAAVTHRAITADASPQDVNLNQLDQSGHWPAILDKHVIPVLGELLTKIGPPNLDRLPAGVSSHIAAWRAAWLAKRRIVLAGVPEQITRQIRDAIAEDVTVNGPDPRSAASIVRELINPDAPTWQSRAMTIARTEVVGANNQGGLASWSAVHQGLTVGGAQVLKTWLATDDSATRPDHAEIDGTEIGIGDTFTVGGEEMTGPGDDNADPAETINCRCTLTYRVVDADGNDTDASVDDQPDDALTAAATEAPVTAPTDTAPDDTTTAPYEPAPYEKGDDETRQCPSCELFDAPDAIYCDQCGEKFPDDPPAEYAKAADETVQCPQDQAFNEDDASFCDQCGYKLAGSTDVIVAAAPPSIADTPLAPDDAEAAVAPGTYPDGTQWAGPLCPVDTVAPDRRVLGAAGCVIRPLPLPLSFQMESSHGGEEAGKTAIVGRILGTTIDGGNLLGYGDFLDPGDNFALMDQIQAAAQRVQQGLGMVSVDVAPIVVQYGAQQPDGTVVQVDPTLYDGDMDDIVEVCVEWELMGVTLVADPAFGTARVAYVEGAPLPGAEAGIAVPMPADGEGAVLIDGITASAGDTHRYPAEWFEPVALDGPTGLTVTEDGRVYGHLALSGTCHTGFPGECVTPPSSATGYSYFHLGEVDTTAGPLAVGKLTVGGGHAAPKLGWRGTVEHYDNAGATVAVVRAHEDDHGIQVTGAVVPTATKDQVFALKRSPLSGDWRRIGGNLELVAALGVNVPGFPVPRAALAASGQQLSLVAAGVVHADPSDEEPTTTGGLALPSGVQLSAVDVSILASAFAKASQVQQQRDRAAGELRARFVARQREQVRARIESARV